MLKKPSAQDTSPATSLPVPFTLEELRTDILEVFLFTLRELAHMVGSEGAWRVVGKEASKDLSYLFDPSSTPEDLGLKYRDIENTDFAKYVEAMYLYGFQGIQDESVEAMDYETVFTWITAILDDAADSHYIREWGTYDTRASSCAAHCLLTAETANARRILEGYGNFYYFHNKDGSTTDGDVLDVRQMALLSGFEEMSIRAAANPSRPNRLVKLDIPNQTRFSVEEAKKWLMARGRYVPITRQWAAGDIDLSKRSFSHTHDAYQVIYNRLNLLDADQEGQPARSRFEQLCKTCGYAGLQDQAFLDDEFLHRIAEVLQLPPELFALRMREAYTREELERVKRRLRDLDPSSK